MVANGRPLKAVLSSASVVRKPERTLGSSRRDCRTLEVTSWNIQGSQSEPVARSKLILDHILKGPKFSDIIHLQEVRDRLCLPMASAG